MGTMDMGEAQASPKFVIRDLKSKDVWQMVRIIRKLGISNLRDSVPKDILQKAFATTPTMMAEDGSIVPLPREKWTEAQIDAETEMLLAEDELLWALLGILIDNIGGCENEVNQLLANGIGVPVAEIAEMDANDYVELIAQYMSREGFKDFFMRAWKLFQRTSPSRSASGDVIRALTK